MDITATTAQEIVVQMKDIIFQEINFMNKQAVIIASTDKTRIGDFHGGAEKVIKNKKPFIIEYDDQFIGSKKGINMPIQLEDDVVGVIGITGTIESVGKYGQIIKKMTEILIKENVTKDISMKRRNRSRYILEHILPFGGNHSDYAQLTSFNYNYDANHLCAVGQFKDGIELNSDELYTILDYFSFPSSDVFYMIVDDKLYVFMQHSSVNVVSHYLHVLAEKIKEAFGESFYFATGPLSQSEAEARHAFVFALETLDWNTRFSKVPVDTFENMDYSILASGMKKSHASVFVEKILSGIPQHEYGVLKDICLAYGNMNKSISKAADKLFIHKNSIQYNLNKLKKYTGYDPLQVTDYLLLYMAFLIKDVHDL